MCRTASAKAMREQVGLLSQNSILILVVCISIRCLDMIPREEGGVCICGVNTRLQDVRKARREATWVHAPSRHKKHVEVCVPHFCLFRAECST